MKDYNMRYHMMLIFMSGCFCGFGACSLLLYLASSYYGWSVWSMVCFIAAAVFLAAGFVFSLIAILYHSRLSNESNLEEK